MGLGLERTQAAGERSAAIDSGRLRAGRAGWPGGGPAPRQVRYQRTTDLTGLGRNKERWGEASARHAAAPAPATRSGGSGLGRTTAELRAGRHGRGERPRWGRGGRPKLHLIGTTGERGPAPENAGHLTTPTASGRSHSRRACTVDRVAPGPGAMPCGGRTS